MLIGTGIWIGVRDYREWDWGTDRLYGLGSGLGLGSETIGNGEPIDYMDWDRDWEWDWIQRTSISTICVYEDPDPIFRG